MLKQFASRSGDLYRIELHLAGPDPRAVLRESKPTPDELAELRRRVERMGPWAMSYLHAIAEQPGVRAPDLAEGFGMETRAVQAARPPAEGARPDRVAADRLPPVAAREGVP